MLPIVLDFLAFDDIMFDRIVLLQNSWSIVRLLNFFVVDIFHVMVFCILFDVDKFVIVASNILGFNMCGRRNVIFAVCGKLIAFFLFLLLFWTSRVL